MPISTPWPPRPLERPDAARALPVAAARADWVDAAKGLGIVAVVAGHALDGLLKAGLAPDHGGWARAFFLIYSFHMPLFFALAGLFVAPRLARDPGEFVRSAFTRIAWPYLLWSVLQLAVIDALGSAVNTPTELDASRVLSLLWMPTSQFWFLQALLLLHLTSWLLLPRTGALGLLAWMLVARLLVETVALPVALAMPARFGVFYALGVVAAPWLRARLAAVAPARAAGVACAAAVAWAAAALAVEAAGQGRWSVAALPAALAGSAMVIALAAALRGTAARGFAALGRASMAIYVLHVLFVAGTRIVLHRVGAFADPGLLLAAGVAAGLVGPWLLWQLAQRAGLGRVLGIG